MRRALNTAPPDYAKLEAYFDNHAKVIGGQLRLVEYKAHREATRQSFWQGIILGILVTGGTSAVLMVALAY